jgi:hypothetical protein
MLGFKAVFLCGDPTIYKKNKVVKFGTFIFRIWFEFVL